MGRTIGTGRELFNEYSHSGRPVMVRAAGTHWDENYCFVIEKINWWGNPVGHEFQNGKQIRERSFRSGTLFELYTGYMVPEITAYYFGTETSERNQESDALAQEYSAEIQQLQKTIEEQSKTIEDLKRENEELKKQIRQMKLEDNHLELNDDDYLAVLLGTKEPSSTATPDKIDNRKQTNNTVSGSLDNSSSPQKNTRKTPDSSWTKDSKKTVTGSKTGNRSSSTKKSLTNNARVTSSKLNDQDDKTPAPAKTCKNCRLLKNGTCNGMRNPNTCPDYSFMPAPTEETKAMWPTEMMASYLRRKDAEKHGER